jgi:hypothetical protein
VFYLYFRALRGRIFKAGSPPISVVRSGVTGMAGSRRDRVYVGPPRQLHDVRPPPITWPSIYSGCCPHQFYIVQHLPSISSSANVILLFNRALDDWFQVLLAIRFATSLNPRCGVPIYLLSKKNAMKTPIFLK